MRNALRSKPAPARVEGLVDVGAVFPTDPQPLELVQPRQAPLHHPPLAAESGAVEAAAASDHRPDATRPQRPAVFVMVVAAVDDQRPQLAARSANSPAYRRDRIQQRQQLGDVVAVAPGSA